PLRHHSAPPTLSLHDALPISAPRPARLPVGEELRPGLLRLADEDRVGQVAEVVLLDRHPRAADHELRLSAAAPQFGEDFAHAEADRKSTRLNSSHLGISYAVF